MEDLAAQGFRLSSSAASLDGAHVFLALQYLGKLHALSYSAKVRQSARLGLEFFFEIFVIFLMSYFFLRFLFVN